MGACEKYSLSMKSSAMATRGITMAATVGTKNWFKRGQLPLSSSMWEKKLLYSSASDVMAVKHNTKNANTKNAVKAAAPALLVVVVVSTTFLEAAQYLALVGGLVKVDGYVCQEEAQDKVVNIQA